MRYYGLTVNQNSFLDLLLTHGCCDCDFLFSHLKLKSKGEILVMARQLRYYGYPIHIYGIFSKSKKYYFLEDSKDQAIDMIWKENKGKVTLDRLITAIVGKGGKKDV